jgi:hypothetical protein
MNITNTQLLKQLITEIETTLINDGYFTFGNTYNVPKRAVLAVEHINLLDNNRLPVELINELGCLIQTYGKELLEYINNNCPPLPFAAAIAIFIYQKERQKFEALQRQLNPSKDLENIIDFRLSDYLALGYQFYDALYFTYFHRYRPEKFNIWGMDDSEYYQNLQIIIKQENEKEEKPSKRRLKPKPFY